MTSPPRLALNSLSRLLLLVVCIFPSVGCHKNGSPEVPLPSFNGVKVDLPRLTMEFAAANPEAQTAIQNFEHNLRYGLYPKAATELERLARLPNLNDGQKKAVAAVTEQFNQVVAKAGTSGK